MPSPCAPSDEPALRFALCVRPERRGSAWSAELLAESGERHEFVTPLDLVRHLARLGPPTAPGGGLR